MKLKIKNPLFLSVISIGITSFVSQVIILREFLSVYHGNELTIGIAMASWMLLIGLGAFLGRFLDRAKNYMSALIWIQSIVALLPIASVFIIRLSRYLFFPVGMELGLQEVIVLSLLLMLPLCILSGLIFTLFCKVFTENTIKNSISKVYYLETIGSIVGGVIFNFVLIYWLETFESLFVLAVLNLICAALLSNFTKLYLNKVVPLVLLSALIVIFSSIDFEEITLKYAFPNQEIIKNTDTPYGKLVVTETEGQLNFYENGMLLFVDNDIKSKEEDVHYAMIQAENPQNVLLVSGGVHGAVGEILKYPVSQIDYLEINPELVELVKIYTGNLPEDKALQIKNDDVRIFLGNTKSKYDVVLINVPEPSTAQINRYYTKEFFSLLCKHMNDNAILSISLPTAGNYSNKEDVKLYAILYNTLKKSFSDVAIIPAGKSYFLASNSTINSNLDQQLHKLPENNLYVNRFYVDVFSLEQRGRMILKQISKQEVEINKDFHPIAYFYRLKNWINQHSENKAVFLVLFIIVLLVLVVKFNAINIGLFTGGFTGSALEVVFILAFQIAYGYVYNILGIIILAFMVGLAIGVKSYKIIFPKGSFRNFISLQIILGAYALSIPLLLWAVNIFSLPSWAIYFVFIALTLDIAILVGMEFAIASKLKQKNVLKHASAIYSSDMLGASMGALVISAFLIPLIGILYTCILIGLLNLLSASIGYFKRANYE